MKDYSAPHKMNEPQSQPVHIETAIDMANLMKDRHSIDEQLEMVTRIKAEILEYWQHLISLASNDKLELEDRISHLHENLKKL